MEDRSEGISLLMAEMGFGLATGWGFSHICRSLSRAAAVGQNLKSMKTSGKITLGLLGALLLTSCNKSSGPVNETAGGPMKVRVGYIGLTCEAPIFTAMEKGFFKEENLDVTLVKCEWANYKDVLALGGYDVTHHLIMYFLKPIEQGLDVKLTGGIHRGCLRVQARTDGKIRTVEDLRGKRIGVPGMGTP